MLSFQLPMSSSGHALNRKPREKLLAYIDYALLITHTLTVPHDPYSVLRELYVGFYRLHVNKVVLNPAYLALRSGVAVCCRVFVWT